jgi:hypothetical protein
VRDQASTQPRHPGGITSRLLLLLAVTALPACSEQNPTGSEEAAVQLAQTDALTADAAADFATAGSQAVTAAATATRLPRTASGGRVVRDKFKLPALNMAIEF